MANGHSLHIGLNYVDPAHYNGWDGKLNACESDARDMQYIAASKNFKSTLLLREKATINNVKSAILQVASNLENGDIFYISYSGHGGQLPDINGDEADGIDETWCLFDGQLVDDELKELWTKFKKGVRIFVTSDSCHSGSITKSAKNESSLYSEMTPRFMNDEIALSVYESNKSFYDKILSEVKAVKSSDIEACVLLISGCQDNQYSYDGPFNGAFTGALKRIWNGGKFNGNYADFHKQILNILPAHQSPNLLLIGQHDFIFKNQKPYSI